jgi:hypothetical protein
VILLAQAGVYTVLDRVARRVMAGRDGGITVVAEPAPSGWSAGPARLSQAVIDGRTDKSDRADESDRAGKSGQAGKSDRPANAEDEDMPRNALTIGSRVLCLDGDCGEVSRILLDPVSRRITHVVVSDLGAGTPGWLVPLRVAVQSGDHVQLACSREELGGLELVAPSHVTTVGKLGAGGKGPTAVRYRDESLDEAAIRPEDQVRTGEGVVGSAIGVVTDPDDPAQMTHLLVEMGEERKRVAVPNSYISSMSTGAQLTVSSTEVWDLPVYAGDGHRP